MGYNVFLTGQAGSGKTYLLNKYIAHLRAHGVAVAVTASTGIAATHLGGQTIHSWSGIGVREAIADEEIADLLKNKRLRHNFKNTKVLVLDEISMLHAHQLDMVERIARHFLDFTKPFGGLQVILTGDFFQLPPVTRGDEKARFAFEADAWHVGGFHVCYLGEQHRQKDDPLLAVLNDIRSGSAGEHTKIPLRTRYKKEPEGPFTPTKLYARNINVDAINQARLGELSGEEHTFTMETRGFRALVESLKKNCLAPETLILKKGAEVMFVKNDPVGAYVNGTRGTVFGFDSESAFPLVRTLSGTIIEAAPVEWTFEEEGKVRAMLIQIPLRLAWAITIHKSQGMTLESAEIDLSDAFEPGMGYVALSRVRALSGLKLMGLNETALRVHESVLARDADFRAWSEEVSRILAEFPEEAKKVRAEETLFNRFRAEKARTKIYETKKHTTLEKNVSTASHSKTAKPVKGATLEKTLELVAQKYSISKIAETRGLKEGTIIDHIEQLHVRGLLPDITHLKPPTKDFARMKEAIEASEDGRLASAFEKLKGAYSYEALRLARLFL